MITKHESIMRRIRKEKGLTQQQLADRSYTCVMHISLIERGKRVPNIQMLVAIARGLEVNPHRLLEEYLNPNERIWR